jgi:hypothetical protein
VVQYRTLSPGRCALDVLPGQPRVAEQHDARTRPCLDDYATVKDGQLLVRLRLLLQRAGTYVRGDQLVAWPG